MNKKQKLAIGSVVGSIIGVGVLRLIKLLSNMEPLKYSDEWMKALSDSELDVEREKIRQAWCSGSEVYSAVELESILNQFDREISDRAWDGSTEYGYPKHSGHGWYLSDDD